MATTKKGEGGLLEGFSPASPPRIFWNSRKRSANGESLEKAMEEESRKAKEEPVATVAGGGGKHGESPVVADDDGHAAADKAPAEDPTASLSERRRALFEPLGPAGGGGRIPNEDLLPPPDFDAASYPKGWLVGKKRKLVNVDVVESMRRIAVQEMNRKDREIEGLNEQLGEDARCLEHLQVQLLEERRKRAEVERENAVLQNQISMLMDMIQDADAADPDDGMATPPEEHS
ncbi:hypothetical protein Taro_025473 [Colocasia esculenta]|uniref:Protein HEADING DATE REPRESSOR 1 n=1 Tax=Colocasia esculenta TaxID=4460 RepID=A0A843VEC4_COLES|nr:hypothetical protein [Colocasia esculenta]